MILKPVKPHKRLPATERLRHYHVRVDKCKFGRGVFATKDFKKGELIEAAPIILVDELDAHLQWIAARSPLERYYFDWFGWGNALALGYGSLYNHSTRPNAEYSPDGDAKEMLFYAVKPIKNGDQIFVNYGYNLSKKFKKK